VGNKVQVKSVVYLKWSELQTGSGGSDLMDSRKTAEKI